MYENALFLMLIAWALVFVLMSLLWLVGRVLGNYAIVDLGWGLCISSAAIVYFILGTGDPIHKTVFAFMATVWGWRLSYFILTTRILTGHEDRRYTAFRKEYGDRVHRKFFTNVFQFQGLLGTVLSLPFVFPALNPSGTIHPLEILGLSLFAVGIVGESVADFQLSEFKRMPENLQKVCDTGLWKYSRHPNYFFEWVIWVSFGLVSLASPWGWIGLVSPIVMFVLLTQVTGIPLNEQGQLELKGEAYLEYSRKTSAFVPWFPKE